MYLYAVFLLIQLVAQIEKKNCLQFGRLGFDSWVRKTPWSRKWQPTPVLLPGKSHGQRSLAGYNPWDHKESDMTEYTQSKLLKKKKVECLLRNSEILFT